MAKIPENVIIIHIGTHASIPSDYTRETSLDDKFPKISGDSVAPNNTGGATTHTHTSPAHYHTLNAHTHGYTTSAAGNAARTAGSGAGTTGTGSHSHTGTTGAVSGGDTSSDALTYGAVSNDPPSRKVIFIKAKAGGANLFENAVMLSESNTPPSNWSNVSELQGRYLKGASAGANADLATNNGSSTNLHDISHTHTPTSHTHANAATAASNLTQTQNTSGSESAHKVHTHTATTAAGTQGINANADVLTTAETVEPAYKTIQAVKMGATGKKEKLLCGLWLGAVVDIPKGWVLVTTYKDKHLKIGDPANGSGGSNTHTHGAQAHGHTGSGTHNHTGSTGNAIETSSTNNTGTQVVPAAHTHTYTTDSQTINYANANTTANSSSNEPAYRTVALIRFEKEIGGGAFLLSIL